MVDPVTAATVGNANDDWEVAADTGELDKRLAQQDKARASNPEPATPSVQATVPDDDTRNTASFNIMNSNKPIRILKRPTSQSQISAGSDAANSAAAPTATSSSTTNTHANNSSTSSSSSSATVPVVSIIPRNPGKDSSALSETIATPVFSSTPASSSQVTKPAIKTYEQRELEYRLARLRIMGEEESSAKDDDETPAVDVTPVPTDENVRATTSSSTNRAPNMMSAFAQPPFQSHSTPGSYASELYALNNVSSNTGAIHFTPNHNNNNSSTPNLGTGPFSSPNFPQHYRNTYTGPYSHMLPTTGGVPPRYPLTATTTTTLYMTSTAPFTSAPSSTASPTYHYPPQQHPHMSTNNWYHHYQHPPTPYGAPQYGHPQ